MTDPRVLTVGVDGSDTSVLALQWAAREAAKRGATLRAVHAFALPVYGGEMGMGMAPTSIDIEALQEFHDTAVAEQLAPIRATYPALAVESVVEIGSSVGVVVDRAEDAELVVVGSRGAGSVAALLLGSVAHGVAHRAPCPVVLVPDGPILPIRRIVVGTDGSPAADLAVAWGSSEAALWGAELTLIHVWDHPYTDGGEGTTTSAHLMEVDAMRVLALAAQAAEKHPGHRGEIQRKLLRGSPGATLVHEARESDLLVVGARGRSALRSVFLGSTSNDAIHHAHCPIAVIHAEVG
jgi:nucleotide-binding universal stress UspA family protein